MSNVKRGMHLSNIGKSVRLGRILKPDGRTLIVPMEALWDRPWNEVFDDVVAGGADAVLVTYGILKQYYKHIVGKLPFMLTIPVEAPWLVKLASKIGADGVKVHYFGPFRELPTIKVTEIADECDRRGMPFLFEPVPMEKGEKDSRPEILKIAVRQAVSLGADIVKIYGEPQVFIEATKACPVPVIIAGGPATTDKETLEMIRGAIDNGASGLAFGRRITQHASPRKICKAVYRVIHEDCSVEKAFKELE
jgi:fructose-bisphosphate aldolase/2-amino-3,7-dideoxy-D-threo-hept-6-ulosonate synthase